MVITRIETERLILQRTLAVGELPPFHVFSRATGEELGSASLEVAEERGGWSITVRLSAEVDSAREAVAALTRVCVELLDADRAEVFALADDAQGARVLGDLGYRLLDRARAGKDGPLVDRWVTTTTTDAARVVPRLRIAGDLADLGAPAWVPEPSALALANYAD